MILSISYIGGSVLQCLSQDYSYDINQDIDLFFIGDNRFEFEKETERFEREIKNKIVKRNNQRDVVDITVAFVNREPLKFQFIFNNKNENVSKVLTGFDMDIVQVAFTGTQLICTLPFVMAIKSQTFINYKLTNDIRDAGSYLHRCLKYMNRSFKWLVPIDYDEILALMPIQHYYCHFDYAMNDFYRNVDFFDIQSKFVCLIRYFCSLRSID